MSFEGRSLTIQVTQSPSSVSPLRYLLPGICISREGENIVFPEGGGGVWFLDPRIIDPCIQLATFRNRYNCNRRLNKSILIIIFKGIKS
jgi:hypothetical protein